MILLSGHHKLSVCLKGTRYCSVNNINLDISLRMGKQCNFITVLPLSMCIETTKFDLYRNDGIPIVVGNYFQHKLILSFLFPDNWN